MKNQIIADDEDKVCQLIYKLVDWEQLNMDVVSIVHNVIEALEVIEKGIATIHQELFDEGTLLFQYLHNTLCRRTGYGDHNHDHGKQIKAHEHHHRIG